MLCAGIGTASAQSDSNGYYRFPLNLPHLFSAGFAEMRPNHFHSGIDLKTAGTEGHPLYASADGQIVRIGLQPGGYGRVLYIAHPNGTTTVYGHMQRFTDEVEKFITEERYRLQRNTGDFYPSDGQFPVKRGEQIGLTGNSGSSGGPHVHFEVRESDSQRTLNTIAAGMVTVKDDIPPLIMKIHYIEVDSLDGVAVNSKPRTLGVRRIDPNTYQAASDTPFGVGAKGYFVIEASDRKNDVSNTFGIYRIEARIDGHPFYEYVMDGFTFDMSRYCNAVSYYPIQRNSRNEVFRLAQLDGNPFRYRTMVDRGLIRVGKDERKTVEIDVQDDCGNVSHLKFDIVGYGDDASFRAQRDSTAFKADNRRQSTATQGAVSVSIPAGALYEPIFYNIGIDEDLNTELAERSDTSVVILSDVFSVGDADVPPAEVDAPDRQRVCPRKPPQPHYPRFGVRQGRRMACRRFIQGWRCIALDPFVRELLPRSRPRSPNRNPIIHLGGRSEFHRKHIVPPARQLLGHLDRLAPHRRSMGNPRAQILVEPRRPHLR